MNYDEIKQNARKLAEEMRERENGGESIVGSCTCLTKTPEVKYHKPDCRYRIIMERDNPKDAALTEIAEKCAIDLFGGFKPAQSVINSATRRITRALQEYADEQWASIASAKNSEECGICGEQLQAVRPGKFQHIGECNPAEATALLTEIAEKAALDINEQDVGHRRSYSHGHKVIIARVAQEAWRLGWTAKTHGNELRELCQITEAQGETIERLITAIKTYGGRQDKVACDALRAVVEPLPQHTKD